MTWTVATVVCSGDPTNIHWPSSIHFDMFRLFRISKSPRDSRSFKGDCVPKNSHVDEIPEHPVSNPQISTDFHRLTDAFCLQGVERYGREWWRWSRHAGGSALGTSVRQSKSGDQHLPIRFHLTYSSGWWLAHPSEKYEFVNWDDNRNPIVMGKFKKWQPNHQPAIIYTQIPVHHWVEPSSNAPILIPRCSEDFIT